MGDSTTPTSERTMWRRDKQSKRFLWTSGTIFLTKVLDRLNTGDALLDLLLTKKKEVVRE